MIYYILQYAVVSLILISIIHYLYSFFKTNLTVPKVKDLVNRPVGAYKEIYETIEKEKLSGRENNKIKIGETTQSSQSMKDDLKNFLSNLNSSAATVEAGGGGFGTMEYGSSNFSTF